MEQSVADVRDEQQRRFYRRLLSWLLLPAAALIGRIGESSDYFFIGDEKGAIRVQSAGRLHLGVNDDYLQDNSGAFRVTVYY